MPAAGVPSCSSLLFTADSRQNADQLTWERAGPVAGTCTRLHGECIGVSCDSLRTTTERQM